MRSKAIIVAACLLFAAPAVEAQVGPQIPTSPVTASAEVQTRLAALVQAYRQGPTRESVSIRVKNDRGQTSQSTVQVSVDPGSPTRVRMELGRLVVTATGPIVHATIKSDEARYCEFTLPDGSLKSGLEKLFPKLALPQLVLADRGVASDNLADLGLDPRGVSDVRWRSSRLERGTGRIMLEGEISGGTIRLGIDRVTNRLRTAELTLDDGPVRAIDVSCRAMDAGEPQGWAVDVTGRTKVDALSDLKGDGEVIRVGHALPKTLIFFTTGGSRWEEQSDQFNSVLILTRFNVKPMRDADLEARDAAFRDARRLVLPSVRLRDQLLVGSDGIYSVRCAPLIDEADMTVGMAALLFRVFDSEDNVAVPDRRNETVLLAESS
ncbi:MAG: hypothetical protein ACK58T_48775, partial [Phycisphaerae bacterium]